MSYKVKLELRDAGIVALNSYEEKDALKASGFKFDGHERAWYLPLSDFVKSTRYLEFMARYLNSNQDFFAKLAEKLKELNASNLLNYMLKHNAYSSYIRNWIKYEGDALELEQSLSVEEAKSKILEAANQVGQNLFQHQVEAAAKMLMAFSSGCRGFILADAPRVGKTYAILSFLKSTGKKAVVLAPASVSAMWANQLKRWGIDGIAVGYELFRRRYESEYRDVAKDCILVLDEAHKVKNKSAKVTGLVEDEAKKSLFVVAATGTPFQNSPEELMTVLKVAQTDHKIVEIAAAWEEMQFGRKKVRRMIWKNEEAMLTLRKTLQQSDWYIRRELKEVAQNMPSIIREVQVIEDEDLHYYLAMIDNELCNLAIKYMQEGKQNMADRVNAVRCGLFDDNTMSALFPIAATLRRLLANAKLNAIEDAVEAAVDQVEEQEGVLFFAHHEDVINKLKKAVESVAGVGRVAIIDGGISPQERQRIANDFQEGRYKALILSTRAAGEGLTLSRAGLSVFTELDWNPAVLTQAENRMMNIAQGGITKIARYVIAPHYLEKRMVELVNKKATAAELVYAQKGSIAKVQS
ncbi:MAG: hypothetical protein KatS3mg101_1138 [Patescibacteria group bacterium]|nr:MAG: hypothetical protein KatS3mg101_1138 [Patescibacteria group bacterium]